MNPRNKLLRVIFGILAAMVFLGVGAGALVSSVPEGDTNGIVIGSVVLVLGFVLIGVVLRRSPPWRELQRQLATDRRPPPRSYLWFCGGMIALFVVLFALDIAESESVWTSVGHSCGVLAWVFLLVHQLRERRKRLAELRAEGESVDSQGAQ